MLPVPRLSYSGIKLYKFCPASYYLVYIDPNRKNRAPFKEDTTGAAPGLVVDTIFDRALTRSPHDKSLVTEFNEDRFNDEKLFYAVAKSNLELNTVHLSSEYYEEWAHSERQALEYFRKLRAQLLSLLHKHELIQPYMRAQMRIGTYNKPLIINDQLHITGAFDLFTAQSRHEPGRLLDLKATASTYHLDRDQLKIYQIGAEKLGLKVGMVGFLLFKSDRVPIYYHHPPEELQDTTEKFVQISKKIQHEEFPYTPSVAACKLCPARNDCDKAVKEPSQKVLDTAGDSEPTATFDGWIQPEL